MPHGGRSTTLIPFGRSDSPRHPGFPRRDDAGICDQQKHARIRRLFFVFPRVSLYHDIGNHSQ